MTRCLAVIALGVALSAPSPASAEKLACRSARGPVKIELAPGYTAGDVAAWWTATRCARVVLPPPLADRSSRSGFSRRIPARRLRSALDQLLAPLGVVALGKGAVVVFVDRKAARPGPGVMTPRGSPWSPPAAPSGNRGEDDDWRRAIRDGVRAKGSRHVVVERALVDRILANPARAARSARIVPSMRNGKPHGFKLYAIRSGSILAALGFRNGDTVTAINGLDVTTPDKAVEVYTRLRDAKRLDVALERRGKPIRLRIDIR